MLSGGQYRIGRQPVGQRPVTCRARRRFRALTGARLALHTQQMKGHAQFVTDRAAVNLPVAGLLLDLMVDVYGSQRARQLPAGFGQQL